ncbi:MAG: riboflavin synthase [Candidatus Dadabacteria bacterium]|nr:MAG: riboflavin synthase [Candidatus Dadabacteria bacterium]
MFSGIIETTGTIVLIDRDRKPVLARVDTGLDLRETNIGDSVAVNGVCLTVVGLDGSCADFELAEETLRRTTFKDAETGDLVNIERSLVVGERLHGHFVFGHVDTTVRLLEIKNEEASERFKFELPSRFRKFIAEKGSVALNGVSLTVGEVEGSSFNVYIIPHTLEVTMFSGLQEGDLVNLEVDMLSRYVVSFLNNCSLSGSVL